MYRRRPLNLGEPRAEDVASVPRLEDEATIQGREVSVPRPAEMPSPQQPSTDHSELSPDSVSPGSEDIIPTQQFSTHSDEDGYKPEIIRKIENIVLTLRPESITFTNQLCLLNDEEKQKLHNFLKIFGLADAIHCLVWIPHREFSNLDKIGEGGFSIVYKAKLKDEKIVVLKKMKRNKYHKFRLRNEVGDFIYYSQLFS